MTSRLILIQKSLSKIRERTSEKLKKTLSAPESFQTLGLWISSVIAALVAVLFAKLFHFAEEGFKIVLNLNPMWILFLSPVLFLAAWFSVYKFAPEAAGSGIPQIMGANEMDYTGHPNPRLHLLFWFLK